ncbi:hypothetical protein RI367_005031 [Sorochytrium milnesiophthora]
MSRPAASASLLALLAVIGCATALQASSILQMATSNLAGNNLSPECQQLAQNFSSSSCQMAMMQSVQQVNTDVGGNAANPTAIIAALPKILADVGQGLQQYCSDQCTSQVNGLVGQLMSQCNMTANATSHITWARNLICASDPSTHANCFLQDANTTATVLQQNATLAAQFTQGGLGASFMAGGSTDGIVSAAGSLDDAILSQPNAAVCTPCQQFERQQTILLAQRAAAAGNMRLSPDQMANATAAVQASIAKFNAKCGASWLTTDDSRFALGAQSVPTAGGVSTGQASTATSPGAKSNDAGRLAAPVSFAVVLVALLTM